MLRFREFQDILEDTQRPDASTNNIFNPHGLPEHVIHLADHTGKIPYKHAQEAEKQLGGLVPAQFRSWNYSNED